MVYGIVKLINFAHGDILMLGAYSGYFVLRQFGTTPVGMFLAFIFAMVVCAVISILIERFAYRPLRSAPRLNSLITAIAVSLILQNGARVLPFIGPNPRQYPTMETININLGVVSISNIQMIVIALSAVLMLIFRDSLLGLVAGIQISQNDMVRIGDWITMAKYNADGNVIDIALTTVKVRNFDNTVTMIPSSALISDAFINWRYMSTSKGRRIKRPVWISVTSIREFSAEDCARLVEQGLLEIGDQPVSNLAAFETWLGRMLPKDERISQELTCMVRQTEAGDTGIPVEVYAFTKTRDWLEYEKIQTDIFDKIFVAVPKFDLRIYQRTGDKFQ
jgi:hypothetical protein